MLSKGQQTDRRTTHTLLGAVVLLAAPLLGWPQTATDLDCAKCVETRDLAPGAVQAGRIADEAIRSRHLRDSLIDTAKLRDGAVDSAKLDDGAVGEQQLSQDLVDRLNDLEDPPPVPGSAKVLDFSVAENCVIDEPGFYGLDRNWVFGDPAEDATCQQSENNAFIEIAADITLDLRGFWLSAVYVYPGGPPELAYHTVHIAEGASVTIKNGGIYSVFDSLALDAIEAGFVGLSNVISGPVEMSQGFVTRSQLFSGFELNALLVRGNAKITYSEFTCAYTACIGASGDGTEVRHNRIDSSNRADGIGLTGSHGVITDNVIVSEELGSQAIRVSGDGHVVARNVIVGGAEAIDVRGTRNIVEANTITDAFIGISFFGESGNFYGNNRVSAQTPFDLGDTTQTDWGGNESF